MNCWRGSTALCTAMIARPSSPRPPLSAATMRTARAVRTRPAAPRPRPTTQCGDRLPVARILSPQASRWCPARRPTRLHRAPLRRQAAAQAAVSRRPGPTARRLRTRARSRRTACMTRQRSNPSRRPRRPAARTRRRGRCRRGRSDLWARLDLVRRSRRLARRRTLDWVSLNFFPSTMHPA